MSILFIGEIGKMGRN